MNTIITRRDCTLSIDTVIKCLSCDLHPHSCHHVIDAMKARVDADVEMPDRVGVPLFQRNDMSVAWLELGPPDRYRMREVSLDARINGETPRLGFLGPSEGRVDLRDLVIQHLVDVRDRVRCDVAACKGEWKLKATTSQVALLSVLSILFGGRCWACAERNRVSLVPDI